MLRSVHRFFRETPGVVLAIVGLACAFMVLEIQRMPVAPRCRTSWKRR